MEDPNKLPQQNTTPDAQGTPPVQPTPSQQTPPPPPVAPPVNSPPTPPVSPKKGSNKLKFIIISFILVFLAGAAFAAWYVEAQLKKSATDGTKTAKTVDTIQKKLVVGTDPTFQPMEFMEDKKLVGYDIDLANFLAKEMNTEAEIKSIAFDDLFTSLEKSQIDLIISGVTITEERKQKYDFSTEYLNAGQVIITKKDDLIIRSTVDLKGKKIAVQKGTTNETEAAKYTDAALVLAYPDFEQATKSLVEGKSDAIFTDLPNAKGIIVANPTLKIASDPFTDEHYGVVLRKNDPMVKKVNAALNDLRVKGILTDLKQKWLD